MKYLPLVKHVRLLEELITGMELTVGVIGNDNPHALPPSQAVATEGILLSQKKFYLEQAKIRHLHPYQTKRYDLYKKYMEEAYVALQCRGYARIDCFIKQHSKALLGQNV